MKKEYTPVVIKDRYALTRAGSTKQIYHVVLESQLPFCVGDSLAVLAHNDPALVEELLKACGARGSEEVTDTRSGVAMPLRSFLLHKANLARVTSSLLRSIQPDYPLLQEERRAELLQYIGAHDLLDVLGEQGRGHASLQELAEQMGPLLPRFYSIASSQKRYPGEIHLTVALTTFTHKGRARTGVASHFLSHLAQVAKTEVPVYVQSAPHFHLPEDAAIPLILVGPGTGIAPYRAFLQEREGKHWLFFGERQRAYDYLYEDELEGLAKRGSLKLDLAFSRDQPEKVYVQHKMLENKELLWRWLQEGAYIYVCGDAHRMAKDVDHALHQVAREAGGLNDEAARAYIKRLRIEKRYRVDVY